MSLTSVIRYVQALDSAAADGTGKTGLAFGDITAKYLTKGGTLTSLTTETIATLGTYQAPTSAAHVRIKELAASDPTKGVYEVHFHDTQVAEAGKKLWLFLSATDALFLPLELDLIDVSGRLPAALGANGNIKADVRDYDGTAGTFAAGVPSVNAGQVAGSATAATKLSTAAGTMIAGTVDSATNGFTPTTTEFDAIGITDAETSQYVGRTVVFTSGTLIRQQAEVTAYSLSGTIGHFTVTALSAAPANGVTFIVV